MTRIDAEAAFASCVLRELDIICRIARYHQLNSWNPYSVLYSDDFRLLYETASRMHLDLDSKISLIDIDICKR